MGALMIVGFVTMLLMGLPTLTYFYARQLGRNPRLWFLIGIILPGIATIVLSFLPDLSEEKKKEETPRQPPLT
jgi:RsiW-degrading membrane proteinase PrsW (M82 family)